jgi:hypothetical protein
MLLILWCATILLSVMLAGTIYLLIKVARKVWALEEQIEESLDILDAAHQSIARAAELPVVSDDPVIQQVVGNISKAKNALLLIANKIGSTFGAEMVNHESSRDGNTQG